MGSSACDPRIRVFLVPRCYRQAEGCFHHASIISIKIIPTYQLNRDFTFKKCHFKHDESTGLATTPFCRASISADTVLFLRCYLCSIPVVPSLTSNLTVLAAAYDGVKSNPSRTNTQCTTSFLAHFNFTSTLSFTDITNASTSSQIVLFLL